MNENLYKFDTKSSKRNYVKNLFSEIAPNYDLVNNLITLGLINRWRSKLVQIANPSQKEEIVDTCAGTGALTFALATKAPRGRVIGVDNCPQMLSIAEEKLARTSLSNTEFVAGDALNLPFPDNYFDMATNAFALRNVPHIPRTLREMTRVVKPGGKVLTLDLARPRSKTFRSLYYLYFHHILPIIGGLIHGRREPYHWLSASLLNFPNPPRLGSMFSRAGLNEIKYVNLAGGIAAIIEGRKRERL